MKSIEELNKGCKTLRADVDLSSMEFKALADFLGGVLLLDGFFFTEGNYGKQVVVVANGYKINMPKRYVEIFETIANDDEFLTAVLTGKVLMDEIKMIKTKNGTTVTFQFREVKEDNK